MNAIEKLLHLQRLDREIDDIRVEAQIFPDRLNKARQAEEQARKSVETSRTQMENIEKSRQEAATTLDLENQRLKKSAVKLKQLKTAYEFQALNREIENTKRSNGELEETILKKMEEIETLKNGLTELEASWDRLKSELAEIEQETAARSSEFKGVLASKMEEVEKARKEVDKLILARYNFIRGRRYSDAIVAIKDGSCGGCFMHLPHQMFNEILTHREIVSCPACARLLYYVDPTPTS
jgi:predicted  nucleic acid-binding Zn-ribbon protein